jgi:hypothetical protein
VPGLFEPRRYGAPLVLLVALSTGACAAGLSAQTTSGCRAADQQRSPARLAWLRDMVSSSDSDYVSTRQDLGISNMNASKVTLVSRQADCETAATVLNTLRHEAGTVRQIWLYALGTAGYAVDDPSLDTAYADRQLYFFDRSFRYKSTISGF